MTTPQPDGQLTFDEAMAEQIETRYHTRDIVRRRELVYQALDAKPGDRILDVGCGPGFFVAELLEQVGPAGSVVGVDRSPQMLAAAAHRCAAYRNVTLREAEATSLPVDAASFDRALSVQVLEYVPNVRAALAELYRALRPGGRVLVWDIDWSTVSWHSWDPARMARVLQAWDEHLIHPSLPRTLAAQLRSAGFDDVQIAGHIFATTRLDPESFAETILQFVAQFVAGRCGLTGDDVAAWVTEQRQLDERGEFFFACTQFCFTATRPSTERV
ncbi:MAG: methyltransferase domain-containing protein [Actinomycetota bacterium]|nr:methyltransferase domain-containing protein [Actinomycetota bacterium]